MNLKDKLKKRKEMTDNKNFNWSALRENYQIRYAELMKDLSGFFEDYIKEGLVEISNFQAQVQEEHSGEYILPSIQIHLNNEIIIFYPIGSEILGASGRFDFYPLGKKDKAKVVLLGKSSDELCNVWLFWEPNKSYHKQIFNKDRLLEIIEGWI